MATRKPTPESLPKEPLARLLSVMAWLRDREHGCPWDIDQTFRTIAPYTIEEAYEVADAIDRNDMPALKEELGDLLLQVVYHAQMASEAKAFDFADVAAAIESQTHVSIDRRKLHVDHIKAVGTHTVTAKLHHDVEFPITVEVVAK